MNLAKLQKVQSYITIKEISDPLSTIEYTGLALADYTSKVQHWTVLENGDGDEMLFIDDHHQSSKSDEFRYHETFVHSLMTAVPHAKKVLVLGGAEGCMLREILKWETIENITQVDWDDSLVNYFRYQGASWNDGAYSSPKVKYICDEAIHWLETNTEKFDAIFVDLLDPFDTSILFMKKLINLCKTKLNSGGAISVNGGRVHEGETTICKLADYMKSSFQTSDYSRKAVRVHVPTYQGIWCFLMASQTPWLSNKFPQNLRYFSQERMEHNTQWDSNFPKEMQDYSAEKTKKLVGEDDILLTKVIEQHGC
jgi:spermidine synthase